MINVVEVRNSPDLLFIMGITGSMGPYVSKAKYNIINIINRIIKLYRKNIQLIVQ